MKKICLECGGDVVEDGYPTVDGFYISQDYRCSNDSGHELGEPIVGRIRKLVGGLRC